MPANTTTNKYLRPWSTVPDEELRLLRELRTLCEPLRNRSYGEVMYMQDSATLQLGDIATIIRKLEQIDG
jgi:hypothetical protein